VTVFFEIAYAAASERLCLFTGTGFSKAVTENAAPNWEDLLRAVSEKLPNADSLKTALFDAPGKNRLMLEEAAQVIAIEREKNGLPSLHAAIADIIRALSPSGDNASVEAFLSGKKLDVVTTNYDKLVENLVGVGECNSITPGLPVPRANARVSIYHVHGSVDSPANMVVTSDDYFRFMRGESYFSRKLSTVLYEDTVVILGYSLGDTNLRAILSDYKGFSREQVIGGNIFLVSKDPVDQHVKDYYAYCYGIRVIDSIGIHEFFAAVSAEMTEATGCLQSSIANIQKVLGEGHSYTDNYLRLRSSFFEIVSAIRAIGRSIDDPKVVEALGTIIEKKIRLTGASGAWEQYDHLARWLIYLGGMLDVKRTSIEPIFLRAVECSMTTMSKRLSLGYSWQAYKTWSSGWFDMTASNRTLVKAHIEKEATYKTDALEIVARG